MVKRFISKRTFSTPYFFLKTAPNAVHRNRFGVIISNAAVKKSTQRHFWKRRFAAILYLWPNFNVDFLFIISPKIGNLQPRELKKELDKILHKFLISS